MMEELIYFYLNFVAVVVYILVGLKQKGGKNEEKNFVEEKNRCLKIFLEFFN